jgi:diguanylate cyclase
MGVSEPLSDLVVALVLRRADEALYAAKNVGRNKVYFHDGKQPVLVGAPEVVR